jgi:hypothetical protein
MTRQSRRVFWSVAGAAVAAMMMQSAARAGGIGCIGVECYEEVPRKVIHKTMTYRVQTEQGVYEIAREPSLYGWTETPVMAWHEPEYRTVTEPEPRYEWRRCTLRGREVMCKVPTGRMVAYQRRVMVSPGGWVATGEMERRRVLIRPYKNIAIYNRARNEYVTVRAAIQPEGTVVRPVRDGGCVDCD